MRTGHAGVPPATGVVYCTCVTHPRPTRTFVAENSDFLREILVRGLGATPGVVIAGHACDGHEAIAGVSATKPDIVLLDLAMPGGGGFAVLEALQPGGRRPFFVVLTMHTQDVFRDQCHTLGAHVFLDKASETQRLLDAVHALAGRDFDLDGFLNAFSPELQTAET